MSSLGLPIRTSRLALRAYHETDASWLHRIYSRADVARYLLDDPWSAETAREKVSERLPRIDLDGDAGALALVIEHDQTPIGEVLLWLTDQERRVTEIAWVLDPEHGGKGFAAEAVQAVLALAFDHYEVHRVAAQMDGRNIASAQLAHRVGMRHEAQLRRDCWSKGEWTDTVVFGMLAGDRSWGSSG